MNGFSRIKPKHNVGKDGFGAVELAFRYSRLDTRAGMTSGLMNNYTAGVNWYLNPSARIMLNYIYSAYDNDGLTQTLNAHIVQTRFQVDF